MKRPATALQMFNEIEGPKDVTKKKKRVGASPDTPIAKKAQIKPRGKR